MPSHQSFSAFAAYYDSLSPGKVISVNPPGSDSIQTPTVGYAGGINSPSFSKMIGAIGDDTPKRMLGEENRSAFKKVGSNSSFTAAVEGAIEAVSRRKIDSANSIGKLSDLGNSLGRFNEF